MAAGKKDKKRVWRDIYRLVLPYKSKLLGIFMISMLATGVGLLEPLIYREAVNDIAGLFVQKATNDVKKQLGAEPDSGEGGIVGFLEEKLAPAKQNLADSSPRQPAPVKAKTKKHRVKQAHRPDFVAPRTANEAFTTLLWAVILLFIINILGLIFWRLGENLNVRLSCTIEQRFIRQTFGHVLRLPLSFFSRRSSAALHKQIDQSEEISGTVALFSQQIFPEVISLLGIVGIMFWQNTILALMAISIIPIYLLITVRATKKLEMSLAGYYEKWEEVSARMQDALGGIKTVKLSGAEQREVNRLDGQAGEAYADYTRRSVLSNKYAFWQVLLTHVASALVLAYGGYLALQHRLTPGDVVMFVAYLDMLYDPIDKLASIWAELQTNLASVSRAFTLLDTDAGEKPGRELQIRQGLVEFRELHFGYSAAREVIKGISFTASPGRVTALVGPSGAGKTTLIDLLLKLYEPWGGDIFIDGQPLSGLKGDSVRQNIGLVAADGAIFRGTLADNIRYKVPELSDAEAEAAALAAGMQATLQRLPEGLQTRVGESGFGLSVGERQRVQIARVIASRPRILVLDEATANLDYATESEVKATIEQLRKDTTIIIIAHRYSMVKDADYVLVLQEGRVTEEGSPAELEQREGWFRGFATAGNEPTEKENREEEGTEAEESLGAEESEGSNEEEEEDDEANTEDESETEE